MIIDEITKINFQEKLKDGLVDRKLKFWTLQGRIDTPNWNLLFDPTIWAYQHLTDESGHKLKLHPFQDKIINDKHRFVVVVGANQIGKTLAMCVKALHHAIHIPNASVLIVSRSEQQAYYILDEIKWMMRRAEIDFTSIIDEVENRTELHVTNRDGKGVSVIRCLPCTDSVLAYHATLMICDEIGFWEISGSGGSRDTDTSNYFQRVIVSRTNATKSWKNEFFTMGQIICISNPNGQRGILWELWNDRDFNQYRYCWLANPNNKLEEYNAAEYKLPSDIFDSVYGAEFSSASGGFITGAEWDNAAQDYDMAMPISQSIYLGADFAGEDTKSRDTDSTVMIGAVAETKGNMPVYKIVYLTEFPKRCSKSAVVYPEIERLRKTYNIAGFGYDKQGVGDSVKNDLKDKGIFPDYQIQAFTYSLPDKSNIYYNMKHLFEQRRVIVPKHPRLKEQLMGLRFERTDAGHIKVHHLKEGLHDDLPDALANCLWMASRFGSGVTAEFVKFTLPLVATQGIRKAVLCSICDTFRYSSKPDTGVCDKCG